MGLDLFGWVVDLAALLLIAWCCLTVFVLICWCV